MSKRRSYRKLSALPAYGLFNEGQLIATIRAQDAVTARELFRAYSRAYSLTGTRIKKLHEEYGYSWFHPPAW